jgi:hypothetical protein
MIALEKEIRILKELLKGCVVSRNPDKCKRNTEKRI